MKPLDRESLTQTVSNGSAVYLLTVVARDHGVPVLSTSTTVTVYVVDVNDNAPRFERDVYEAHVSEATPSGTIIVSVRAADLDAPGDTDLQYSLSDQAPSE